jgi:hypothetical protein
MAHYLFVDAISADKISENDFGILLAIAII